jgi:hypothetical protein
MSGGSGFLASGLSCVGQNLRWLECQGAKKALGKAAARAAAGIPLRHFSTMDTGPSFFWIVVVTGGLAGRGCRG